MNNKQLGKPYTMEDLALAMANWRDANGKFRNAQRQAAAKRAEMESFEKMADVELQGVKRYETEVRKILANLENP